MWQIDSFLCLSDINDAQLSNRTTKTDSLWLREAAESKSLAGVGKRRGGVEIRAVSIATYSCEQRLTYCSQIGYSDYSAAFPVAWIILKCSLMFVKSCIEKLVKSRPIKIF